MAKAGPQLLTLLLLLAPLHAAAGTDAARAAYAQGVAQEKAGDFKGAVDSYQAALKEDPAFSHADRQLGNCYFAQGDKKGALREYRIYLEKHSDDAAAVKFAARLEQELDAMPPPEPWSSPPRDPGEDQPIQDSFYAGFSVGAVATAKDDMQDLIPGAVVPDQSGLQGLLKLGFLSDSGFWIEAAWSYGPFRQYSGDYPYAFQALESSLSLEPGFRVALGRKATLGAGVALGLSSDSLQVTSTQFPSQSYSGSNFATSPELKCSLVFGTVGVDIDLGYHISKSGIMKDSSGAPLVVTSQVTGLSGAWNMDNSGMFLRLGAVYYFNPPLPEPGHAHGT